jgi:hypothetical protein
MKFPIPGFPRNFGRKTGSRYSQIVDLGNSIRFTDVRLRGEARRKRLMHYCEISTPLCRLLLVGDEQGLRRISFQDTFRPARPAEGWRRDQAPFRDIIIQLDLFRRTAAPLRASSRARGHAIPAGGLVRLDDDSLRRNRVVRRAGAAGRQTDRVSGRRRSQWSESHPDHHSLSPGHRRGRLLDGFRRRAADQTTAVVSRSHRPT